MHRCDCTKRVKLLVCALLICSISGCDPLRGLNDALLKTAQKLEDASFRLSNQAADFNTIARELKDTLNELPEKAGKEIRDALTDAGTRTSQAAGIEARCSVSELRTRVAEDVRHVAAMIRAKVSGKSMPARPARLPIACQSSPVNFVVNCQGQTTSNTVVWDGYDLAMPLFCVVETRTNGVTTASQKLSTPVAWNSAYQVAQDLSHDSSLFNGASTHLVLRCDRGGTESVVSEVVINRATPPPPKTRQADLSTWGPKIAGRCPNPRNPNADLGLPNTVKIDWTVSIQVREETKLVAVIDYHALEWDTADGGKPMRDFSEACGHWEEVVFTAPGNERILGIEDAATDSGSIAVDRTDAFPVSGKFYREYQLQGDSDQPNDVGYSTSIRAPVAGRIQIKVQDRCN